MGDLIRRQNAIDALKKYQELESNNFTDTSPISMMTVATIANCIEEIVNLPSAESELEIIRCADCKWWDRLEDEHPYGYCRACRSGTHTERWEISIYRQNRYDFYCADAEPKENEDDDERLD